MYLAVIFNEFYFYAYVINFPNKTIFLASVKLFMSKSCNLFNDLKVLTPNNIVITLGRLEVP